MTYEFYKSHAWKPNADKDFMRNCYDFRDIVSMYKDSIRFYFPNYDDAPWQVQAEIGGEKVNFWPHKIKAHVEFREGGSVEGKYKIIDLINDQIVNDLTEKRTSDGWVMDDDFDVFE